MDRNSQKWEKWVKLCFKTYRIQATDQRHMYMFLQLKLSTTDFFCFCFGFSKDTYRYARRRLWRNARCSMPQSSEPKEQRLFCPKIGLGPGSHLLYANLTLPVAKLPWDYLMESLVIGNSLKPTCTRNCGYFIASVCFVAGLTFVPAVSLLCLRGYIAVLFDSSSCIHKSSYALEIVLLCRTLTVRLFLKKK